MLCTRARGSKNAHAERHKKEYLPKFVAIKKNTGRMRRAEQGFTLLTHKKVRILFRIKPTEHVFLTLLIRPSNQLLQRNAVKIKEYTKKSLLSL